VVAIRVIAEAVGAGLGDSDRRPAAPARCFQGLPGLLPVVGEQRGVLVEPLGAEPAQLLRQRGVQAGSAVGMSGPAEIAADEQGGGQAFMSAPDTVLFVDPRVDDVVMRALEKKREQRKRK